MRTSPAVSSVRAVVLVTALAAPFVPHVARAAGVDCAQCRSACQARDPAQRAYPEELGPESPSAALKHKSPEAEAAFTDARRKDPAFGGRDLAGAVDSYRRAVAADPENSQYRNHLAGALMAAGDVDSAIANLNEAVRLVPSEPKYLVNLGYAHHRRGDETRALLYYMRGLMLDPHDVRARLFSGYALEILGYNDEAILELKKVLNQDEKNEGARRALARLGALGGPSAPPPPAPLSR